MRDSAVAEATPVAGAPAAPSAPVPYALPLLAALLLSAASGAALALAFPGIGWWPMAPVAVAGLALATRGARARSAALMGWIFGLAFFVPHLHWSGIYVGAVPWFALAGVEAAYLAAMAAFLPRAWRIRGGPLPITLAITGLWVAQEAVRGRAPFGGFPWGRLVFSQADAPTAGLAAFGGAPLVTAAVAAIGALAAIAIVSAGLRRLVPALVTGLAAAAVLLAGLLVPLPTAGQSGARAGQSSGAGASSSTLRVAAVQGDVPEAGLEFNAERRAVLDNHVKATLALATRVAAGQAKAPDLVIWPENSSDIDPLRNPDAADVIDQAVGAVKVPIVLGAVLDQPVGKLSNASIVWSPQTGPGEIYVKQHPAPFGEYMPYRSFFRRFSSKVDLIQTDFTKGTKVGMLPVAGIKLGDVICFEVAYDGLVRDSVKAGASLIAVQTNNATFGYTDESVQQLAMSRIRAIESGRAVVHISTVGISAVIEPDGTVEQRSGHFTQQVLEADVPLRTSLTIATRVGEWPEWILAALGALLVAFGARRTARAAGRTGKGRG